MRMQRVRPSTDIRFVAKPSPGNPGKRHPLEKVPWPFLALLRLFWCISRYSPWCSCVGGRLGSRRTTRCCRTQAPRRARGGQALAGHGLPFLALLCSGCGLRANRSVLSAHTWLTPRAPRSSLQGLGLWDLLSRSPSS